MAGKNLKAKNMVSDMMNELFYKFQNIFIKRQTESFNQTLHYHNFAAQFGGATVIDKNQGCQNAKSVLSDDKDKYLMNECSRNNKYITIMLKEDVTVEGFSIINKEFYSSNVKDMEIYGSQTYPTQEWVLLGKVKAQDNSNWQDFELKNVWIRFIKFVFLTHYREEYFCTITQLKVFGNTMLQDLKSQVNLNLQEKNSESEDEEDIEHSDKEENFSNIQEEENSVNQQIKLIKQQLGKREKTEYSDKFNQLYSTYNDNNCPAIIQTQESEDIYSHQNNNYIEEIKFDGEGEQIYVFTNKKDEKKAQKTQLCMYQNANTYFLKFIQYQCQPLENEKEVKKKQKQEELNQQSVFKTLTQHIKQIVDFQAILEKNEKKLLDQIEIQNTKYHELQYQNKDKLQTIDKQDKQIKKLTQKVESQYEQIEFLIQMVYGIVTIFLFTIIVCIIICCFQSRKQ